MELRVGNKYKLGRRIGGGSFGEIYHGTNISNGEECAIKLEPSKTKHPQLFYEYKLYKILQGGIGIPLVFWFGVEGDYNVMVMELLGQSIEDLFQFCGQKISLKSGLMLADQMLRRVEFLHSKCFIHRDIKPDNFTMGSGTRANQCYMIDFGLAKKYRDSKTHQHIQYRENKSLTGTARYASVNAHLGIEQSRRDDLESLGYVWIYIIKGSLPWQGLKADNKRQKYERIVEKKISTPIELLCKGLPTELSTYLTYCKALHFEDKPDYEFLRKLLRSAFAREGFKYDGIYDWMLLQSKPEPRRMVLPQDETDNDVDTTSGRATRGDTEDQGRSFTPGGVASPFDSNGNTNALVLPSITSASSSAAHATRQSPRTASANIPVTSARMASPSVSPGGSSPGLANNQPTGVPPLPLSVVSGAGGGGVGRAGVMVSSWPYPAQQANTAQAMNQTLTQTQAQSSTSASPSAAAAGGGALSPASPSKRRQVIINSSATNTHK
eukprot:TRINITY_DN1397_c0_g1_i2.p1 TRINITY_DN1397_c0_g1~~TRINITY_DN1397_c0_g1_i2.p1  ORF type:complete len:495 (-),score=78.37 TRINITY_DN1397_c0_g1_i2:120-1604(-)